MSRLEGGRYQNHHRWYSPDLGRYLSSDPMARRPSGRGRYSASGSFGSTYSYAASSPLEFVDPMGLEFFSLTREERAAIDRLKKNRWIGDRIKFLDETKEVRIFLKRVPGFKKGAFMDYTAGVRSSSWCVSDRPASATITYDLSVSQQALKKFFGLEMTLDQQIAHELGHLDYAHEVHWNDLDADEAATDFRSVFWENAARDPGDPQRPSHEPL